MNINTDLVQTIIKTQILQVLQEAPKAIETLVDSALKGKVDEHGKPTSYGGTSYLDWVVTDVLRSAVRKAVEEKIGEYAGQIKDEIAKKLTLSTLADEIAKVAVDSIQSGYRINVKFEKEPRY